MVYHDKNFSFLHHWINDQSLFAIANKILYERKNQSVPSLENDKWGDFQPLCSLVTLCPNKWKQFRSQNVG